MAKISLTQDAYAQGGFVQAGVCELTEWYEASAKDAEGNVYRIIWKVSHPDADDESLACDWENPWSILDDHYSDVSDSVKISA